MLDDERKCACTGIRFCKLCESNEFRCKYSDFILLEEDGKDKAPEASELVATSRY